MKSQVNKVFLLIFASSTLINCAGIRIVDDRAPQNKAVDIRSQYQFSLFIPYFAIASSPVDLDYVCRGKKWESIYVTGNPFSFAGAFLSASMIHPYKVTSTCLKDTL